MAVVREILDRRDYRWFEMKIADAYDLGPPAALPSDVLVREPGWTHFEFDFDRGEAVFLDVGASTNLFEPAFSYFAAFRASRRYATLPIDEFLALTAALPLRRRLVHLFNPGHCGSTLVHKIFNASGVAWSLSEPKAAWELSLTGSAFPRNRRRALIEASLKSLSLLPHVAARETLVLKHFSQVANHYADWRAVAPDATNLYLDREALAWCNSLYGFVQRLGYSFPMAPAEKRLSWVLSSLGRPESFLDGILDLDSEDSHFDQIEAIGWLILARLRREAEAGGMVFHSFDYDVLNARREETVARLFAASGLPASAVAPALTAFDGDSHEGEVTSHDKPVQKFDAAAEARIRSMLSNPMLATRAL
jgi:hypothetical protein